MSNALRIAREEWRLMLRDRVALMGFFLLTLLAVTAALTSWEASRMADVERTRRQVQADAEFDAQPDRHPHRMVHYGHFVFRRLNPLAAFDMGVDAYTGHTLFLEGHRQNSANFGDVRQSSLLLRFGQLTPAFVMQVLVPLLLIFIGHGVLARERQTGTLRVLLAQGVRPGQVVLGKLLAVASVAGLTLLPSVVALAWMTGQADVPVALAAMLAATYVGWLLLWAMVVVGASAMLASRKEALVGLIAAWAVMVVLLPRLASETAKATHLLPTRFESDLAVARDLAAMGDSHDPDDPYFADFRKKVLEKYGVSKVEDLPVNYKGLLGSEGERMTSELFNRYATWSFERQVLQVQVLDRWGWLSPTIALRRASMTMAGTDLDSYRAFLEQGERYRYGLIQALNQLQAEQVSYADDRNPFKENRIDRAHWQDLPAFHHEPVPTAARLRVAAKPAGVLLTWLAALSVCMALASKRLGRAR